MTRESSGGISSDSSWLINFLMRISSSLAASSVKVTAAIDFAGTPSDSIMTMRPAMMAVFPDPAPASTSSDRSRVVRDRLLAS